MPTRRQLLAAAGAASLSAWGVARAATPAEAVASSYARFDGPFHAGFSGTLQDLQPRIEGRLPPQLRGTLYRNGPARMRLGPTRYRHWFDGDGMVQALRIADGRASHRGVLLRTPKLLEEEAAGRFLYPAFGTSFPDGRNVPNPDAVNTANINLLPLRGGRELYALWEGGSALRIDPHTLAADGFHAWSRDTAGAPFSAHPRISPDGTVWNFGYMAGTGKLLVYEIAPEGRLRRQAVLQAPQADMVHDFAVTQNHLVFLLMPMVFQRGAAQQLPFADRFGWDASAPLIALVVSKADFSVRRFELPNGGVFHLGNAWEHGGSVHFGYARSPNLLAALQSLRSADAAALEGGGPTTWMHVRLDLASGRAVQHGTGLANVEFPRFDTRRTGEPTHSTVLMARSASMHAQVRGFDSVLTLNEGHVDRYVYGSGWIAEEHLFVPRPGRTGERDGWILGTAYHWERERTMLAVFDAAALSAGPLATVHLAYGLPLGLHGQFVAAL